jgi:HK97 gp10 family phage protein
LSDSLSVKFDTAKVHAAMGSLAAGIGELVRPVAQAGAQVLYDEAKTRAPVSAKGHWFHGTSFAKYGTKYWFDSGALKASIYQVYSKDHSGPARAVYHVSWNHKEAPYGFMVENGTSRAPAHPFLRPSFDAKQQDAVNAANAKMEEGMNKLLAGGRV